MKAAGVTFYDTSRTRFPRRRLPFGPTTTLPELAADVDEEIVGLASFSGR